MKVYSVAILACLCVASAQASFDLMLLPDQLSGGIVRYDPVNRIRLGSFATGNPGNPWHSVNLSNTSGQVYLSGDSTMKFDYSSGTALSSVSYPIGVTTSNLNGTRFVEAFGGYYYTYDASMGTLGNFQPVLNSSICGLNLATDRTAMMGIDSLGNLVVRVRNDSNGALASQTLATAGNFSNVGAMTLMSQVGSLAIFRYGVFSGANLNIQTLNVNLTTLSASPSSMALNGFSNTGAVSITRAHDGFFVIGRDATTPTLTRIAGVNSSGIVYTSYTTSDIRVPTSIWVGANIVAPEPGSMAALGLGLAGLLKRRKRS